MTVLCCFLQVPFICDLKPSGKYVMEDVHKVCVCVSERKRGTRLGVWVSCVKGRGAHSQQGVVLKYCITCPLRRIQEVYIVYMIRGDD